jgi:chorismate synthase
MTGTEWLAVSHNSFGHLFRITTWGESHGPALGCVIDGTPPGIPLTEADIQAFLDKRRPGQSRYTSQRKEPDQVRILSGVFQDDGMPAPLTTGTPISLIIENVDQRSKDYSDIREAFRPGHADLAYEMKYGLRDYRGGGRQSARETAARVAAGAVARKVLAQGLGRPVQIRGALVQMGKLAIDRNRFDWGETEKNPFWCPDAEAAGRFAAALEEIRKAGSSVGAVIEIVASGVPAGLGAPIYGKLDAELGAALMSINAVKGVEIGEGFAAAALSGEENADEIGLQKGEVVYGSNRAGGIQGGISTGQDIVARFAVKPTSSILSPRKTITRAGKPTEIVTKGRHDPCVGIRAVPVGEAMVACVLADHLLRQRAQTGVPGPVFVPGRPR